MFEDNIIEPAQTGWASPIVFAPEKDGTIQFCVNYRELNTAEKRNSYPTIQMNERIDSLGDALTFSALNGDSGYWQIRIDKPALDKTALTSHRKLYRFYRLPFVLRNAPDIVRRRINFILLTVKLQFALV